MNMKRELPSQKYLQECFSYNGDTGDLIWKERPIYHFKSGTSCRSWNTKYAHKKAITTIKKTNRNSLYFKGCLNGKSVYKHRVIWKLIFNEEPETIDHIDKNGLNNKIFNIRAATYLENRRYCSNMKNKKNGMPKGVYKANKSKKYEARIAVDKKEIYLGVFDTPEEAYECYCKEAQKHFGEFCHF